MLPEPSRLLQMAENMVRDAGIDNFTFDDELLVMCGVRYVIEACGCGESDCHGVQLRKADIRDTGTDTGGTSLQ